MKKFWLVWCLDGGSPTYKHDSPITARDEAQRLALLNKEQTFVVLESICDVKTTNVIWNNHDNENKHDENYIPF